MNLSVHQRICAEIQEAGLRKESALQHRITQLEAALVVARRYFERLACLGNGDRHGNSVGNEIAIDALAAIDSVGVTK